MPRHHARAALVYLFCLLAACMPLTVPNGAGTPSATGTPTPWNFLNWPQEPWPPLTPYDTIKMDIATISRLTGTVIGSDELLISAQAWMFRDATNDIDLALPPATTLVESQALSLTADFHEGDYFTRTWRMRLEAFTDIVEFRLNIRAYWLNPFTGNVVAYPAEGYGLYARHGVNGDLELTNKVYFWVQSTPCFGCGVMIFTDTPGPSPTYAPIELTIESFRSTHVPSLATPQK